MLRKCCASLEKSVYICATMATIKTFIRSSSSRDARIRISLSDGRGVRYFGLTDIWVNPAAWNPATESIKARVLMPASFSRAEFDRKVADAKNRVAEYYASHKHNLPDDWITELFKEQHEPVEEEPAEAPDFNSLYKAYLAEVKVTPSRMAHKVVTGGILERYQLVTGETLQPDEIDAATIRRIENFIRDEHELQHLYPSVYADQKEQKPRGQNTINDKLKMLFAFLHWLVATKRTNNTAFDDYEMEEDVFGDPIPLLPEEIERLRTAKIPKQYTLG